MILGQYCMSKSTLDLLKVFFNISKNTAVLIGTCRAKMPDAKTVMTIIIQ